MPQLASLVQFERKTCTALMFARCIITTLSFTVVTQGSFAWHLEYATVPMKVVLISSCPCLQVPLQPECRRWLPNALSLHQVSFEKRSYSSMHMNTLGIHAQVSMHLTSCTMMT